MSAPHPGSERPGEQPISHGPAGRALSTAVRGNSTAFGFSIMITAGFAMLTRIEGPPSVLEILLAAAAGALAVALLEGVVTRGFRARATTAPSEVMLLGTALDAVSVLLAIGVAAALAELIDGIAAWPAAAFGAASAFVLGEACEIFAAEAIQRARGDRRTDHDDASDPE